ncbi:MAG: HNH endonuclease signature motif containing protein [Phenylobacterium sp.]
MAKTPRKPPARVAASTSASPPTAPAKPAAAPPPPRRSHAGRIAAAVIGVAGATGLGVGLNHTEPPAPTPAVSVRVLPDQDKTPGLTDPAVTTAAQICGKTWQPGPKDSPPILGGALTYSQAGRQTSEALKNQVFVTYGMVNPRDGGASYEVDHRIPLSLGGRDDIHNLWPQSRTAPGFNAWIKDRLEDRLYNLVCHPKPGDPTVTLLQAQAVFLGDWTKGYDVYCDETTCPAHGTENDTTAGPAGAQPAGD